MLKFANLTKSQKTFIIRMVELFPEYRSDKNLGAKQIHAAYYAMKNSRSSTGEKLGYPNWLQSNNRVGRGEYQMPWPTDAELSDYAKPVTNTPKAVVKAQQKQLASSRLQNIIDESPVYDNELEDFNAILRQNGIEVS